MTTFSTTVRGILSIVILFVLTVSGNFAQIAGEFVISDTSDYKSFNQAIDSLEEEGLGGMVKFRVMPGTYDERISIGILYTTSEVTQVTFEAYYGDPSEVILTDTCHSDTNYVVLLTNGSSWINFKGITFKPRGDQYGHAVYLENSCHNFTFINCVFDGIYSNPGSNYSSRHLVSSNQVYLDYITFENCTFNSGATSLYLQGNNNSGGEIQGINIVNNIFSGQGYEGINLHRTVQPVISGNTIFCGADGMNISPCFISATVTNNKIYASGKGITFGSGGSFFPEALIANNFIRVDNAETGLLLTGSFGEVNVYHNTIVTIKDNIESYGIRLQSNTVIPHFRIKNNIIACMLNGSPLYISRLDEITEMDHNCYYTPGDFFAYTNEHDWLFSLQDFSDSTGLDSHSCHAYPVFISDTNLHAGTAWFDGKADPVPEVTTDIDGEPRDETRPDVGADEFTAGAFMVPALSGSYTIGSGGDYTDLDEAVEDLKIRGISDNVSLQFRDGEYNVKTRIPAIPGTSADKKVTLTSESQDASMVTLNHYNTNQDTNYILWFEGTDFFTVKNLSFHAASDNAYGRNISFTGGSEKITLENNYFRSTENTNNNSHLALLYSTANFPRDLVIRRNVFDSCAHSIYFTLTYNNRPFPSGLVIERNKFNNAGYGAITLLRARGPVINYNHIEAGRRGLQATTNEDRIVVSGNKLILEGGRGIYIGSTSCSETNRGLIANNFISINGLAESWGLYLITTDNVDVYHNSVHVTGTSANDGRAFYPSSCDNLAVNNNIFSNTGGGYALFSTFTDPTVSDFNDLYTPGTNLAYIDGTDYTDLAGVQGAQGDEANSVSVDPVFTSDTDLHLTSDILSELGTPLPEVPYDIDGQPRDPVAPDLGADEYDTTGNYPPEVLHPIPDISIPEDTGKVILARLDTVFTDPNMLDILTYSASGSNPDILITTEDEFLYAEAPADYYGSSTVIVSATDSAMATAKDTFLLTIYGVNDPPLALDDFVVIEQDSTASVMVLDNDSDPDGDELRIAALIQGDHGTASIHLGAQYIGYDPDDAFTGEDLVRYVVTDDNGGFDTASVYITITPMTTGPFEQILVNLDSVAFGNAIWGDIDNDKDFDMVVCGERSDGTRVTSKYMNNEGVFEKTGAELEGVITLNDRAMAFTDLDYDGYLDLIITGENNSGQTVTNLYIYESGYYFGTYEKYETGLPGVMQGSVDWGDYDLDGDPDLLITGKNSVLENVCAIYRNDGKADNPYEWDFSPVVTNFWPLEESNARFVDFNRDGYLDVITTGINDDHEVAGYYYTNSEGNYIIGELEKHCNGSIEFCDFDADDNLEILLTGDTALAGFYPVTHLLKYDDEQPSVPFVELEFDLEDVFISSADWGDYDNDGDYDLVLSGKNYDLDNVTILYENSNDSLVNSGIYLPGMAEGSVRWGDYDNDGDLDLLMSGYISTAPHRVTLIYKNNTETENAAPSPPVSFMTMEGDGLMRISWLHGEDAETPDQGLTYNIKLKRQKAAGPWHEIFTPAHPDGTVKLAQTGNAPYPSVRIKGLESGALYSCRVQTLDAGLKGSAWSDPFLFNVPNDYMHEQHLIIAGERNLSAEWVDYDDDRDLDLQLVLKKGSGIFSRIYPADQNEVDTPFTDLDTLSNYAETRVLDFNNDNVMDYSYYFPEDSSITIQVTGHADTTLYPGLLNGSHAWGDYDLDGDKDLVMIGETAGKELHSKMFLNEQGHLHPYGIAIYGAVKGDIEWVDYDNDGDLDIAYCGFLYVAHAEEGITRIFENRNGAFVEKETNLPGLGLSDLDFGDYDNDGDPDLLICGQEGPNKLPQTSLYKNNSGTFQEVNTGLAPIRDGSCKWVDVNHDGYLDIVLSGNMYDQVHLNNYITKIYLKDGDDFTEVLSGKGFRNAHVAAGDYNGDDKTDLFIGGGLSQFSSAGILYKNISENFNNVPVPPVIKDIWAFGDSVKLEWYEHVFDSETPVDGISYNLRVGTTPGGSEIMSAEAHSDGTRKIRARGNAGSGGSFTLHNLIPDQNYYYALQTIDASYQGSDFLEEWMFNSSSAFMIKEEFDFGPDQPMASGWMDYDDNKTLDLLVSYVPVSGNKTGIYTNSGTALAESPVVISDNLGDWSMLLNDFNNDNRPDFSFSKSSPGFDQVHIFENTGGVFSPYAEQIPGLNYPMSQWGDIDNDGKEEFMQLGVDTSDVNTAALIYRMDVNGDFIKVSNLLPGMFDGTLKSVDIDNDGDLDFFACGKTKIRESTPDDDKAYLFINQGGAFTMEEAGLPVIIRGDADFGDYDNDGDPDLLWSGYSEIFGTKTYICENTEGTLTVTDSLPGVIMGATRWADFNNDGDLDILVAGTKRYADQYADSLLYSFIYLNMDGKFEKAAVLETFQVPTAAPGDYNNDNRLDLFIGGYSLKKGAGGFLYKNATPHANFLPDRVSSIDAEAHLNEVVFDWEPAIDNETHGNGLSYNLRVGTAPGGNDIVSSLAHADGFRKWATRGNMQQITSFTLKGLEQGTTYYYAIQTIDASLGYSGWTSEQSISTLLDWVEETPVTGPAVFPNPTTGPVNITWTPDNGSSLRIELFNESGQLVKAFTEGQIPAGEYHFGFNIKSSGVYIVKIISEKEVYSRRIVKY